MLKRKTLPRPPSDPGAPYSDRPGFVPLNESEQRFINEWQVDYNQTLAYLRAYPGTSQSQAYRLARQLVHRPHVREEMKAIKRANRIRCRVDAELTLEEVACVAFSDIYQLFDPVTNQLRSANLIPPETRKAIQSVKVSRQRSTTTTNGTSRTTVTDTIMEYKFWPKVDALKMVANYLGLNTSLPPLEVLLSALPKAMGDAIRAELKKKATGSADEGQSSATPGG